MAINNNRIVVLIDMDCFFCQVETRLQPQYEGKPLAVVQYNQWKLGGESFFFDFLPKNATINSEVHRDQLDKLNDALKEKRPELKRKEETKLLVEQSNIFARAFGVTRHMRGKEAKEKCPELILASVPCFRDKADTSRYRKAGREVINVISQHCNIIERASVDEAYLDITDLVDKKIAAMTVQPKELISSLPNTYVVGYSDVGKNDEDDRKEGIHNWIYNIFEELEDTYSQKLAVAGIIIEELRSDIFQKTGFNCSAGISQNKILAKLACGLHKPKQQTILPPAGVSGLYSTLPVKKVRNLGGKFGDIIIESLKCNVMGDLLQYSLQYLQKRFDEKAGLWLYNIARGIDSEPVITRLVPKSIGACKKFPGKQAITSLDVLKHWAGDLAAEVCERLEQDFEDNHRRATLLTVCFHYYQNKDTISQSRSCALKSYNSEKMADECVNIVTKSTKCPVAYLGLSAGKFVKSMSAGSITNFFKSMESRAQAEISNKLESNEINIDSGTCGAGESSTDIKIHLPEKLIDEDIYKNKNNQFNRTEINSIICTKETVNSHWTYKDDGKMTNISELDNLENSPVSVKVNKLIEICNERSKINIRQNSFNSALEESVIDRNKDNQDVTENYAADFKQSFFLNIFKDQRSTNEESITDGEIRTLRDIDDLERNDDHQGQQNLSQHKTNDTYEKVDRSTDSNTVANACAVKLQEIFPDLHNIDPSIIPLLPIELQEEASLYLKQSSNGIARLENTLSDQKFIDNSRKNTKMKIGKSKNSTCNRTKKSPLYGFLVKVNKNDDCNESMKLCSQCGQMISATKYAEHNDFHIAQNLQEVINKPQVNKESNKRKSNWSPIECAAKRPTKSDVSKNEKNCQSIITFFS